MSSSQSKPVRAAAAAAASSTGALGAAQWAAAAPPTGAESTAQHARAGAAVASEAVSVSETSALEGLDAPVQSPVVRRSWAVSVRSVSELLLAASKRPQLRDHRELLRCMAADTRFYVKHARGLDSIHFVERLEGLLLPPALLSLYVLRDKRTRQLREQTNDRIRPVDLVLPERARKVYPAVPRHPTRSDWDRACNDLRRSLLSEDPDALDTAAESLMTVGDRALADLESMATVSAVRETVTLVTVKLALVAENQLDSQGWWSAWATRLQPTASEYTTKTADTIIVRTALRAIIDNFDEAFGGSKQSALGLTRDNLVSLFGLFAATSKLLHAASPMIAEWNGNWAQSETWSTDMVDQLEKWHDNSRRTVRDGNYNETSGASGSEGGGAGGANKPPPEMAPFAADSYKWVFSQAALAIRKLKS